MGKDVNDLSDDELWDAEVEVLGETDKAILVEYEGEKAWIPKSQIHDDSEVGKNYEKGQTGIIIIPLWLAEKESWV